MPVAVDAPADEAVKQPSEEEGGGTRIDLEDKQQVQQLDGAEKTQVSIDEESSSEGGCGAEHTHFLAVAEEEDDLEKVQLQKKKVKKRKRSELKLSSDAEKTHMTVDAQQPHLPCGAEQEHLLAVVEEENDSEKVQLKEKKVKKRKRSELKLSSDAEKTHMTVDAQQPHLPCGAEQEHLLAVLSCIARDVLAIQASTVASESSFSAGGRILTDHRSRLKSKMVEALICLQDWLKAADPKPINKDAEEEECLVFYQLSECDEETAAHKAKADMMKAIIQK